MSFPARVRPPIGLILILGSMAALPAVTTDLYLPSMPEVVRELETTETLVHATITGVLIGGAIGQLITGPISDRYGRRRPVMVGVAIHCVASLLCVFAPEIFSLLALRVIQGIGNATATVTAMAVIRDRYTGAGASVLMSRLMLVIGVAPLLAPTAGGLIADIWHWRATFVALAIMGVLLMVFIFFGLRESLPPERRQPGGLRPALGGYKRLVTDGRFMALAVMPGLGMAVIIAYVAASPFVMQQDFGLSETQFALAFAANGAGLIIASQLNASLANRVSPLAIIRVTAPLTVALGIWLLIAAGAEAPGEFDLGAMLSLMIPLFLMLSSASMLMPNTVALALSRYGERAGSAASVVGSLQAGLAGGIALLVGAVGGGHAGAADMAVVMLGSSVVALIILAIATPAYRRRRV